MARSVTWDIILEPEKYPDIKVLEKQFSERRGLDTLWLYIVQWDNRLYGFYVWEDANGMYVRTTGLYPAKVVETFKREYRLQIPEVKDKKELFTDG
jgi:hypothetical protein